MSETLYMRISTQNIACSQRQMNTCHTSDQLIWLVSEKQKKAINAHIIKNSKGEGGGGEKPGGASGTEGSQKDWAELYGCIK